MIHLIEPFVIKLVAQLQSELIRPFNDREREAFKTMTRRALEAEREVAKLRETLTSLALPLPE